MLFRLRLRGLSRGNQARCAPEGCFEHIYQTDNWPTGCESVTAVMALNAAGIEISVDDFIDDYLCMHRAAV